MSNPNVKHKVDLSSEQREKLDSISRNGHSPAKKILHARVLLMADLEHPKGGKTDGQISDALGIHVNTVARIRKKFATEGETTALERCITPPTSHDTSTRWGKGSTSGGHLLLPGSSRANSVDTEPLS